MIKIFACFRAGFTADLIYVEHLNSELLDFGSYLTPGFGDESKEER